ncbi:glycoside hydrolase family 18 protein [Chitinophaga pollutisoli]|uniref:chitinase n=1 Tax=Chitinophaga pollutisoli TaxID=3133966 RepID=A0ABZ2YTT3_9BACT
MRLFSKPMRAAIPALLLIAGAAAAFSAARPPRSKPVVIAYVGGFRGLITDPESILVEKITHINYAFVDVQHGQAWLTNLATDTVNFRKLNALKSRNPDLKILISIGGWAWSENFSDAVLTEAGRKLFAHTSVDIIRKYQLDGVDIDWEYPGIPGEEGNVYRPEDKQNFTLMFAALRASLDTLEKETGRKYLLTSAVGGSKSFVDNTEMAKAAQYQDFINIMSYDYKTNPNGISGHHTNLFGSTDNPEESSAHRSIGLFLAAGVPAEKIVMGIAFYGRGWKVASDTARGLNRAAIGGYRGGGYSFIKDSLPAKGFERHWDKRAKAPYLWHPGQRVFISYDDEASVKEKCRYVHANKLGGVMFWEYSSDPKGYLLDAIHKNLHKK